MQFANIELSWTLLIPLCALGLGFGAYRRWNERMFSFCSPELLPKLVHGVSLLRRRLIRRVLFSTAALLLLVLAVLRPQWGFVWEEVSRKGVDIVIALDLSVSMLAQDVPPSRLERAKRELTDLLRQLRGDRVGLVAFAGSAFLELPLTLDYAAFGLFLDSLNTDLIPVPGTNIEAAIEKSLSAFGPDLSAQRSRAILLITDGEELEGDLSRLAAEAGTKGVRIYVMGIGTEEGSPIPTANGYKKDQNGSVIITKLRQDLLAAAAERTGGVYVKSITTDQDTLTLYDLGIKSALTDEEISSGRGRRFNEYYQLPLALALALLVLGRFLDIASSLARRKTASLIIVLLSGIYLFLGVPASASAQSPEALGAEAKEEFVAGNFNAALELFKQADDSFAGESDADSWRFSAGRAASHYRLGQFSEAAKAYQKASELAEKPADKAAAFYGYGNSLTQQDRLEDAITVFEESLKLLPDDIQVKENLAYVRRLLEERKNQEQSKDSKQNKDSKQDPGDSKSSKDQDSDKPENKSTQGEQNDPAQKDSQQISQDHDKPEKDEDKQENIQHNTNGGREDGREEAKPSYDASKALLDSLQEDRSALQQFRKEEALNERKEHGAGRIVKDW